MKNNRTLNLLVAAAAFALVAPLSSEANERSDSEMKDTSFEVEGMVCGYCSERVETALRNLDGVKAKEVSHEEDSIKLSYAPAQISATEIAEVIEYAGFRVKAETAEFPVEGMACAVCVRHLNEALDEVEGISERDVSRENGTVTVTFDPAKVGHEDVLAAIQRAGFSSKE